MCQSKAEGGQRCYSHALAAYETAERGRQQANIAAHFAPGDRDLAVRAAEADVAFQDAMATLATTEHGRMNLQVRREDAPAVVLPQYPNDVSQEMIDKALAVGDERRERNGAVRDAGRVWDPTPVVRADMRTPWGKAQYVSAIAPGIGSVGTAGHGGVKLSRQRNAAVPKPYRQAGGWYEEDCDAALVIASFPDEFDDSRVANADRTVRDYYPDQWEKVTGKTLQPGESSKRDEQTFFKAHANDMMSMGAWSDPTDPDSVVVTARVGGRRGAKSTPKVYRVSRAEYRANQQYGMVIDPARHPEVDPETTSHLDEVGKLQITRWVAGQSS